MAFAAYAPKDEDPTRFAGIGQAACTEGGAAPCSP